MGKPSIADYDSARLIGDIARRRAEFKAFVEAGRVMVVVACPPQEFYYDTGKREYSGTGRNRHTTTIVATSDVWAALPANMTLVQAAGTNLAFKGPNEFASFWAACADAFHYRAVIGCDQLKTIAVIKGTDRVVAGVIRVKGGGAMVFIPSLNLPIDEDDEDAGDDDDALSADAPEDSGDASADPDAEQDEDYVPSRGEVFDDDLRELIRALGEHGKVESLPEWTSKFHLPGEGAARGKLTEQEQAIADARLALSNLQTELATLESRKRLFAGSGRGLELEVAKVFELLGGTIEEPEAGRDDWRVTFPDEGVAVVEVKGVSKSAAEKHAAQLEKWVASHLESRGTPAKGLLVVNAWSNLPIDQRDQPAFPDQMIAYSKARGHCLITGLQLLVISAEVSADPTRAEFWRKKIMTTSGRLPGATKWAGVLVRVDQAESASA